MMMEAARNVMAQSSNIAGAGPVNQMTDAMMMQLNRSFNSADDPLNAQVNPFNLSPAAAAAAQELIQRFITNPGEPISTEHFLQVQKKYDLPPYEAYQLLLQ